jgi:hypothetical protein
MSKEETVRETVGPSWLKQVVVAADASPASNEGLNLAADIARRTGTRLAVVHVRHALAGSLIGPGLAIGVISETLDELEVLTGPPQPSSWRGRESTGSWWSAPGAL